MKTSMMTRSKGQVYSVGNYLMTGKVLGKGHFARVEEATHRIIGKKVAIKIIDLTCIKEEYARRNLHREPTVMARLRHPCIAALYETMMHGPRLYVVMEAAGGGDLCALVLNARSVTGVARGLPEGRARNLAAQLVSAVRHMHARGVVHRDLKMENIMLDSSKTFIKIVDFGLSNLWNSGGGLHTPCGSLEYAAPELFKDTRRYGPELDLWSIGVIVYGMVIGSLPFVGSGGAAGAEGEGRSRPQLRAAIARGFSRKHRAALMPYSPECRTFIQHLLEPNVESRMKIEEAARHLWLKRPGLKMRTHPFGDITMSVNREIYNEISDLCGKSVAEIMSQTKSEPYGSVAGMYNIKAHLAQLNSLPIADPLWSNAPDTRPLTPPEYKPHRPISAVDRPVFGPKPEPHDNNIANNPKTSPPPHIVTHTMQPVKAYKPLENGDCPDRLGRPDRPNRPYRPSSTPTEQAKEKPKITMVKMDKPEHRPAPQPYNSIIRPMPIRKPIYKVCDNGDCMDSRLPSIAEHRRMEEARWPRRDNRSGDEARRLATCPPRLEPRGQARRTDTAHKYDNWRAPTNGPSVQPPRILLQSNATTIKRASLGNITSPHSSANSYCKSERAMPVGWYSTRSGKEPAVPSLQRIRRTAPIK